MERDQGQEGFDCEEEPYPEAVAFEQVSHALSNEKSFASIVFGIGSPESERFISPRVYQKDRDETTKFQDRIKGLFLKVFVGYKNPQKYWNIRWKLIPDEGSKVYPETEKRFVSAVQQIMQEHDCKSLLDVGCGRAYMRNLPGYLGLDFSLNALKSYGLKEFVYADMTERIPLPDKSFDASYCSAVLGHIPDSKVENAVKEICRVTKKVVILNEDRMLTNQGKIHCFDHNLNTFFAKHWNGHLIFLNEFSESK